MGRVEGHIPGMNIKVCVRSLLGSSRPVMALGHISQVSAMALGARVAKY